MKTNPNAPANPCDVQVDENGEVHQIYVAQRTYVASGLTIRQHFAAMAMQGMISHPGWQCDVNLTATDAVLAADALIKALNETSC